VRVGFGERVSTDGLADALRSLVGDIAQRTPRRVAHRRADLIRTRRLHVATGEMCGPSEAELNFVTDGGLYIKELVSGDGGRTQPNLAARLGVSAVVRELDVLDIASDAFPDAA
jgi:tRNA pseudouridine synthase 10